MVPERMRNIDPETVKSFGDEWSRFDQSRLGHAERTEIFEAYFSLLDWASLPQNAEGFDMGCGSGRWAELVAPKVGKLNCIDASEDALNVAKVKLSGTKNVVFHLASVDDDVLPPGSQDFGYSLGVLHHVPDTASAIASCVKLLKPDGPFLVYLYYSFENKPLWFRATWHASEVVRKVVCRLPAGIKSIATDVLATVVYWPMARLSAVADLLGLPSKVLPLSFYRDKSFYIMRTDCRDRFGTILEQRFSKSQIVQMMRAAGLKDIRFADGEVYWCALGFKA